jgi:hypothetical protein
MLWIRKWKYATYDRSNFADYVFYWMLIFSPKGDKNLVWADGKTFF